MKQKWYTTALLTPLVLATCSHFAYASDTQSASSTAYTPTKEDSEDDKTIILIHHWKDDALNNSYVNISAEDLEAFNTVTLEQHFNTLPLFTPNTSAFSNNPGDGTVQLDMRGLGAERTLVLVNGSRFGTVNGSGQMDINAIPAALVRAVRVETSANSSMFGSGAIAGTVNLILDDLFVGNQVGASTSLTGHGDGTETSVYGKFGREFNSGRGQAMIFASYNKREGVFAGKRDFSRFVLRDDGTDLLPSGSSGVPTTRLFAHYDFTNAGYTTDGTTCTPPTGASSEGLSELCAGGATFDDGGEIIPWINSGPNSSRYNYAADSYLQTPQDRFTIAAFAHYDLTDDIDVKLSSIFTSTKVPTQLAPTPLFTTVTVDLDNNPFLSPNSRAVMRDAFGGGQFHSDFIGRRMSEIGPRRTERESENLHLAADMYGAFSDDIDWTLHGHYARTTQTAQRTGGVSISATQSAIFSGQCNIFGANVFSDECVGLVSRQSNERGVSEEYNISGFVNGSLTFLKSPKAETAPLFSFGGEYRKETYTSRPDQVLGYDIYGINQSPLISGGQDNFDVFGALNYPIIEGQKGLGQVSATGSFRYSRLGVIGTTPIQDPYYSTTDENYDNDALAYQMKVDWEPSADYGFFISYDKSYRQPSLSELFTQQTVTFPGVQDPCARGVGDNTPARGIREICLANGVLAIIYGTSYQPGVNPVALVGGNTSLSPEHAQTISFGFSAEPQNIPGLELAVKYFAVEIEDGVGRIPAQALLNGCFIAANLSLCERIHRRGNGVFFDNIDTTHDNVLSKTLRGVDLQFRQDLAFLTSESGFFSGDFSLNAAGTLTLENTTSHFSHSSGFGLGTIMSVDIDCAGYHQGAGGYCGTPISKWKHTASLAYADTSSFGVWGITARWRFLSNTQADPLSAQAAGSFTPRFATKTGNKHYFDLSGNWQISGGVNFSAGVQNVFGTQPPIFDQSHSEQANTFPSTYDPLGRRFFIAAKAEF